jgi:hypothetical protein
MAMDIWLGVAVLVLPLAGRWKIMSVVVLVLVFVSIRAERVRTRKRQWPYWGRHGPY